MITKSTVLILGAGASKPFGYPLGAGLTNEIMEGIRQQTPVYHFLRQSMQDGEPELQRFGSALLRSGQPSIDKFLEERKDSIFLKLGKAAMAFLLCQRENEDQLFSRDPENWYLLLLSELASDGFDAISKNKLTIVTFNYDRSLRHFLFTALKNTYNKPDDEIVAQLSSIPILHMYGDLGPLPPFFDGSNRVDHSSASPRLHHYTPRDERNRAQIFDAAENIRLIADRHSDDLHRNVGEAIKAADRVHMLGFGFEKINLSRLGIEWETEQDNKFSATTFQLGQTVENRIRSMTRGKIKLHPVTIRDYFLHRESL